LVIVLLDKLLSGPLNLIQVIRNNLSGTEKLELILDFNQVITSVGINTSDRAGKRNEILDNLVDNISDTVFARVALNAWVEDDFTVLETDFNVKHGLESMMTVVRDTDLVREELHGGVDTSGDTLNNQSVDVVLVLEPGG